jgi:opacity protein-like surface antigen
MRSLLMAGMLLFALTGSARAQDNPKGEIAGNYTYIHINPGVVNFDCHGGGGSAAWSLNQYLGVVGEFSACKWAGIPSGLNAHTLTYLFGPRLTYRAYGRLDPFGEVLFGGAHIHGQTYGFTGSGTESSFAMAIGGGVDYKWKPSVAIRLIQADYLYTRLGAPTTHQNNFRLQAGVVFRFGGR